MYNVHMYIFKEAKLTEQFKAWVDRIVADTEKDINKKVVKLFVG